MLLFEIFGSLLFSTVSPLITLPFRIGGSNPRQVQHREKCSHVGFVTTDDISHAPVCLCTSSGPLGQIDFVCLHDVRCVYWSEIGHSLCQCLRLCGMFITVRRRNGRGV